MANERLDSIKEARDLVQLLVQIKGLKHQIFGADPKTVMCFCFGCGKFLGNWYIVEHTGVELNENPLCHKCFKSKFDKIASPQLFEPRESVGINK